MKDLMNRPVADAANVRKLRGQCGSPEGDVALGLALAEVGCCYEAAQLLRPNRGIWKGSNQEATAQAALDAQAWWNKHWRDVAQAMQAGHHDAVLALVAGRIGSYWDQPALLLHLASIAQHRGELDEARHLYSRVVFLSDRGLPKMNMDAFSYVSRAGLIDVLAASGDVRGALEQFGQIKPNPGNAMAHEILGARLLAMAGQNDEAMMAISKMLVTARGKRRGYSRDVRLNFVETAPELTQLRTRDDWQVMLDDPGAFTIQRRPKTKPGGPGEAAR